MAQPRWSNRIAFVITTTAFAIGLGNIWRFPYVAGEGGGGAFLLVYILLIALVGIPIFLTEISLGRMAGSGPLTGFGKLGGRKEWNLIGWVGVSGTILVMSYYVMILAWILIYFWSCITKHLTSLPEGDLPSYFDQVVSNQPLVLLVIALIMAGAVYITRHDLQKGLERHSRWMLFSLLVLIVALAIWSFTLEGAAEAYRWYLRPDFDRINSQVILSALGQMFFSVGVAMVVVFAFGSYTSPQENLVQTTIWVVIADTAIAILAGFMIFPALFTFGLDPDSGSNLIFITMAHVFQDIPYGEWVGAAFFVLLFLGGFTSLITSIQGAEYGLTDRFGWSKDKSLVIISLTIFILAIPVCFSYVENPIQIFGRHFFSFFDLITNSIMLPLGGLLIVLFGAYVVGAKRLSDHVSSGSESAGFLRWWRFLIKVIAPIAMVAILLNSLL